MAASGKTHHRSGLIAVGLILTTITMLVAMQYTRTDLPPLEPLPPNVLERYTQWSEPLQEDWARFSMTTLSDGPRVREQLTLLAREAVGPPDFEVTEEKRAALVDAAAVFLDAWSSPSAADYFRKLAPHRIPLEHPADGQAVLSCYQPLTGRSLPLNLSAEEVLDQFWSGRPDCHARPTMASLGPGAAIIDFAIENKDLGPRNSIRRGRLSDASVRSRWMGPLSGSVPHVTAPSESYEDIRRVHGPEVETAFMCCIVQSAGNYRCVMQLNWYWSPDSRRWHLRYLNLVDPEFLTWAF